MSVLLKLLFCLCLFSVMSCSGGGSSSSSSGPYTSITVTKGSGGTVACSITFLDSLESVTTQRLPNGDSLTCGGQTLTEIAIGSIYTYSVSFTSSETSFTVVWNKSGVALSSTASFPEEPVVTTPSPNFTIAEGQTLSIAWTPSSNSTDYLRFNADVIYSKSEGFSSKFYSKTSSLPENGSDTLPASAINMESDISDGTGTLAVKRYRPGTLASGITGVIQGVASTNLSFTVTGNRQ